MEEQSLSNLIKVTTEFPETLVDKDLEEIVCVWNRKIAI